MFKSTREFDKAVYTVLKDFLENDNFENIPENINEKDYNDVLKHIISVGYITNANITNVLSGNIYINGFPSISRSGLSFIENYNGAIYE